MGPYRRSGVAAAAALLLLAQAAPAPARIIDGVVATVDEEPVTLSEVREAVSESMGIPQGDADTVLREERDPARIVRWVEPLVESILVRKALAAAGAAVDNQAVEGAIASVRKGNNLSEADFAQALAREGLTMAVYRKRIRWQMERGNLVRARKSKEVTVTDDELKAYFAEQGDRFREGAEVRFETLLVPPPEGGDSGDRSVRLRLAAQRAGESTRAGRPLKETASLLQVSIPGTKVIEADFLKADDLAADLARELHRLRPGESSPPFFTDDGARIVRLLERRGGTLPDFAAVKETLAEELADRRSEKAYADLMNELKKSAAIDIRL